MNRAGRPEGEDRAAWVLVLGLLPDALAQAAPERGAWLARQGLESRAEGLLAALLRQRAELEGNDFLGQTAGRGFLDPPLPDAPELVAGAMIGRFRLLDRVGEGGMSVVWRAEQQDESFSRVVALKFPRQAGVGVLRRLERERSILGALEHPAIARLYDVGVTPLGLPFIAMEYVPGVPVDAWCHERAATLAVRLDLLAQICVAVQFAHANLVLHRDLKPSNILVDDAGRVHLLDFGIAKVLEEASGASAHSELTRDVGLPMTPAYASPEQLRGEPLSVASDVYALGLLMYELLTGTQPFADRARRAPEVRHPELPSRRAAAQAATAWARGLAGSLRGDLDAILIRALDPRPTQRYGSVASLHEDLLRHRRHEPVQAMPPRRLYVLGRFLRRHRMVVSAASLSLVAVGAGAAMALVQADRAADEAARARAVSEFLVDVFQASSIDAVDAGVARRQTAQELLSRGAQRLVDGGMDHFGTRRELRAVLGRLLDDLSMTDEALALRRQQFDELERVGAPPIERAEALIELGSTLAARGDLAGARAKLEAAQATLGDAGGGAADDLRLRARLADGKLALREGQVEPARALLRSTAAAATGGAGDLPTSHQATWLELQAGLANVDGRVDESAAALRQAAAVHERLYAARPARLAMALYRVSNSLWEINRADEAWVVLERAHHLAVQALGADHISTLLMGQQLGRLLVYRGDIRRGQARLEQATQSLDALGDRIEPTDRVRAQDYLAEAYLANGRLRQASQALERAQGLIRSTQPLPFDASAYHDVLRARVLTDMGRYDEALDLLRGVERAVTQRLGAGGPAWMDVETRVIDTLQSAGRTPEAWDLLARLDRAVVAHGALEAQFGEALRLSRASLLMDLGRAQEARRVLVAAAAPSADGSWHQGDLSSRWRQGRLSLLFGRAVEAERAFASVVAELAGRGYDADPALAEARGYLARALAASGRLKEAGELAALARRSLRQEPAGPHFARALPPAPGSDGRQAVQRLRDN